ncbi:zinc finger C2HC domain-containing protein 1A [Lepeophtheirus salmonis]
MSEEEGSGRDMMYVSSSYDDVPIGGSPKERIIEASPDVIPRYTLPCPTCGRTFVQASLERHVKVCEKVLCTKRKVFPIDQKRTKELPKPLTPLIQKKVVKPPDEFLICKYCGRKFGYKAFDRHESWCEERSKRMQLSPNKDMVALAKLQMRNTYRPKTPIEPLKK